MELHRPDKPMAETMNVERSFWPLDVLVRSGWFLTVASIGLLFTGDPAPLDDGYVKVAMMSILVGGICWLCTRQTSAGN